MRSGDVAFALVVATVVHATGCARILGIDDWTAHGSDTDGAGASGSTGAGGVGLTSGTAGAGGAGAASGGGPAGPCGKTSLFADGFDSGLGPDWALPLVSGNATIYEDMSDAVISLDGWAPCTAEVASARYFDLTGDSVTAHVTQAPTSYTATTAELWVGLGQANTLRIRDDSSVLYLEAVRDGMSVGVPNGSGTIQYDPTDHAFWRIREEAGTVYWEASANGSTFDVLGSLPTSALFPVEVVGIALRGTSGATEGISSTVRFGDLNGGMPNGVSCKIRSLVDDFDDPTQSPIWALTKPSYPCVQDEDAGTLRMTPSGMSASTCEYVSASDFDLTDSSLGVEVVQVLLKSATSRQFLRAKVDDENYVEMYEQNDQLVASYEVQGDPFYKPIPFDQTKHRYWRIRESSGTVYWEAAGDSTSWTPVWQASPPMLDLRRVQVVLGAETTTDPVGTPGAARFDNLNLHP